MRGVEGGGVEVAQPALAGGDHGARVRMRLVVEDLGDDDGIGIDAMDDALLGAFIFDA